jgi:hypothetical protein
VVPHRGGLAVRIELYEAGVDLCDLLGDQSILAEMGAIVETGTVVKSAWTVR